MKIDARKLPPGIQEEKRKLAIRLYKKDLTYKEIADVIELHFETIGKWVRAYRANGIKAIESQRRGTKMGTKGTSCKISERVVNQKYRQDRNILFTGLFAGNESRRILKL